MQEGRHSREAKLADEDGGVETGIALLRLDRLAAFSVGPGERSQDYGNELSSAFKRSSREVTLRTDGQDDLVTGMLLEVVVPRKCLSAKRTRLAVVQRTKQAPSAEGLRHKTRESANEFFYPLPPLLSALKHPELKSVRWAGMHAQPIANKKYRKKPCQPLAATCACA